MESYIAGDGLAYGYLNRSDLTAEKFIPNPFSQIPGERMYKTGDLARYHFNGEIEFLGRIDQQVKIRGFRIELGEIESLLLANQNISNAVVIVRENIAKEKELIAYVVARDESQLIGEESLKASLQKSLPNYMVPKHFVTLDHLPLTANGKVDHKALPALLVRDDKEFIEPSTLDEMRLAKIWCAVLNVEKVSIHDNFFECGGNSLLSIKLQHSIKKHLQINIPVVSIFKHPTIAELALLLEELQLTSVSPTHYLNSEVELDETITPSKPVVLPKEVKNIFLTGATGFLGAFLLHELLSSTKAQIHCLIRADNDEAANKKLRDSLSQYGLWEPSLETRVKIVRGELGLARFGLNKTHFDNLANDIDLILHNGALVNFVLPYELMKATNVEGMREILHLATHVKTKPLHYVSTISVFPHSADVTQHLENDVSSDPSNLGNGYAQSKWVAERLAVKARNRGVPLTIYRPGQITGHSVTGAGSVDDMQTRRLRAYIELGAAPHIDNFVDMTPVDYVARSICHCIKHLPSDNGIYHLINSYPAHIDAVLGYIKTMGYPITIVSIDKWMSQLEKFINSSKQFKEAHPFAALLNPEWKALKTNQQHTTQYDCTNAVATFSSVGITCPRISEKLTHLYINWMVEQGVLPHLDKNLSLQAILNADESN